MLKLFTDTTVKDEDSSYTRFLYPAFGKQEEESPIMKRAFDEWTEKGGKFYSIVEDIEDADYVLIPTNYQTHTERIDRLIDLADKHNKKAILFSQGDIEIDIDRENLIGVSTSIYSSSDDLEKTTIIPMPSYTKDILEDTDRDFYTRKKSEKPKVGFCGWAGFDSPYQYIKSLIKKGLIRLQSFNKPKSFLAREKGVFFRQKALNVLKESKDIDSNFIIRGSFLAGLRDSSGFGEEEEFNKIRQEYIDNILESDFTLCVKGNGNYSIRFYETAALGRIPLFLDTDCSLPFSNEIDYESMMPIVDFENIKDLPNISFEFYNDLTEEEFENLQKNWRDVYENYFTPFQFFSKLCKKLEKRDYN